MDCKVCRENIHDYIHDNLLPEENHQFDAHLNFCAECRREVDLEKNLSAMLDQWDVTPPGKSFDVKLNERLALVRQRSQGWFRRLFFPN